MQSVEHTYVKTNGITLHVAQSGPEDGELILLLHGFPEFWYGWRKQITHLAKQGFRVWAPDMRGYNLSDKPEEVSDYQLDYLTADVAGLIRSSGKGKAILVGHDWGGIVAWRTARDYPELLEKLVILNAPHEAAMAKQIVQHPDQLVRSSYIGFFQLRGVPEKLVELSDWEGAVQALKSTSQEGTFSEEDLDRYREAWSQPDAMKSMINYYRANATNLSQPKEPLQVQVPVLILWGAKDQFLGKELARYSLEYCEDGRGVLLGEATHWVQHEEAEQVNERIVRFAREEDR